MSCFGFNFTPKYLRISVYNLSAIVNGNRTILNYISAMQSMVPEKYCSVELTKCRAGSEHSEVQFNLLKYLNIILSTMLVSKVEIAFLVLSYLKEEKFKDTYDCFVKESFSLIGKIPQSVRVYILMTFATSINKRKV